MPDPREIRITYRAEVDESSFRNAANAIRNFDLTNRRAADGIGAVNRGFDVSRLLWWASGWTAAYGAIRLVTGQLKEAVGATLDLDAALRNFNAISRLTEAELAAVRQQVRGMSVDAQFGFRSMKELAEALYTIASAGVTGQRALEVLGAASAAARAGLTDVETAATGIVTVLQAYGLAASEAARVSDILFKTVEVGVPPFEQVARHFGVVAATASLAKVPLEELGLVWATLSRTLVSASLTTTSLQQVLLAFIKPSEAMERAVERLGFASAATLLEQKGLIGALRELDKVAGGNAATIATLFNNVRAYRGAAVLMGQDLQTLTQAGKDWGIVGEEAGATTRAMGEQMKAQRTELDRLRAEWGHFTEDLASRAIPVMERAGGVLADFFRFARESRIEGFGGTMVGVRFARYRPTEMTPEERSARAVMRGMSRRPLLERGALPSAPLQLEPTLEELFQLFTGHQLRGRFTDANEIRAISSILIPAAEKELEAARKRASEKARDAGEDSEEAAKALRKVEELERSLLDLEIRRIGLAKGLAEQLMRQADLLERAARAAREADFGAVEGRLRGTLMQLDLSLEGLEKYRGLMADILSPESAAALRKEIESLSLRQVTEEISSLRTLLAMAATPEERVRYGTRLQQALAARAGIQSRFGVEGRQAEFATTRARLQREIEELDLMISVRPEFDPGRVSLGFIRTGLQARLDRLGPQLEFTKEEISKPYEDAANEIARIQREIVNPALAKSQDDARGIAQAALEGTQKLYGQIVGVWGSLGTDAARQFIKSFQDEYGRIPQVFPQPKSGLVPMLGTGAAGTAVTNINVNVNGANITSRLKPGTLDDIAAAIVSSTGDAAVRRERRLIGGYSVPLTSEGSI